MVLGLPLFKERKGQSAYCSFSGEDGIKLLLRDEKAGTIVVFVLKE